MISASSRNRGAAGGVVGVTVEDLLERHLAIQLGVERDEHGSQSAPGMRSKHAEPLAVAGSRADGIGCRAFGVISVVGRAVRRAGGVERRVDLRAANPSQALSRRLAGRDGGHAFLHVAAVGVQVDLDKPFQQHSLGPVQVTARFQVVGQTVRLIQRPDLKCGHELALVDDPILQREQSEEEMAVGGGVHGAAPGQGVVPCKPNRGNRARSRGEHHDDKIIA